MKNTIYSLFDRARYFQRSLSADELKEELRKCARLPYTSQVSAGTSFNRLIFEKKDDFVFPAFMAKTFGYPSIHEKDTIPISLWSADHSLHTSVDWTGHSIDNLAYASRWISSFYDKKQELDIFSSIRLDSFECEFYLNGWPIHIKYRPPWHWYSRADPEKLRSRVIARPFGWRENCESRDFELNYDIVDPDGIGLRVNALALDIIKLFEPFPLATDPASGGDYLVFEFEASSAAKMLDHLIAVIQSTGRILTKISFQIPALAKASEVEDFITDFVLARDNSIKNGDRSQLSYCPMLDGKRFIGFVADGVEYLHGNCFHEAKYDTEPSKPEYLRAQEDFLMDYVDWLNATAHLTTVSGVVAAYSLLFHHKDLLSLVVLPFGNRFVLCVVPQNLNIDTPSDAELFSVIGGPEDWYIGKIPTDKRCVLPTLKDRHSTEIGEFHMPILAPYSFQNHMIWLRKFIKEYRIEEETKRKSNKLIRYSLDYQIEQLLKAGLKLSPGIKAEDFLLIALEREYQAKPYAKLFSCLNRYNNEGVIFCPQVISNLVLKFEDYKLEVDMMKDFKRACRDHFIIDDINFDYFPYGEDSNYRCLKSIQFTANDKKITWLFNEDNEDNNNDLIQIETDGSISYTPPGDDNSIVRGHHILVEYLQTYLKNHSDDLRIYKIKTAQTILLCLPKNTAESINKLIKLEIAPDLSEIKKKNHPNKIRLFE